MDLDDAVVMTVLSDDDDDDEDGSQNVEDDNNSQLLQQTLQRQMESEQLPHNQRDIELENDGEENVSTSLNALEEMLTADEDFEITTEDNEGNLSDDEAIIVETADDLVIEEVDKDVDEKNSKMITMDDTASKAEMYMALIEGDEMDEEVVDTGESGEPMSLTIVEDGGNQDDNDVMLVEPSEEMESIVPTQTSESEKSVKSIRKTFSEEFLSSKGKGKRRSPEKVSTSHSFNSNNNSVLKKLKVSLGRTEIFVDTNNASKTLNSELKEKVITGKKSIPSIYQEQKQHQQRQEQQQPHIENARTKEKRKIAGIGVNSNKRGKFATKSASNRNNSQHVSHDSKDTANLYSIKEFLLRSLEMVALKRHRYPIDRTNSTEYLIGFDEVCDYVGTVSSKDTLSIDLSSTDTLSIDPLKSTSTANVDQGQKPSTSHANDHLNPLNPNESIKQSEKSAHTNIILNSDTDLGVEGSSKSNSGKLNILDKSRTKKVVPKDETEEKQSTTTEDTNLTKDIGDKSAVINSSTDVKQQQINMTANYCPTNGRSSVSSTTSTQLTDSSKSTKKISSNKKTSGNSLNSSVSTPISNQNKSTSRHGGNVNMSGGGSTNKKQISPQDDYYKKPFEYGWKRELVWRASQDGTREKADVYFITPNGKKLRARSEIAPLLEGDLTIDHFCFARESLGVGPELETVRSAKPSHRATAAAATLAAAAATTPINIGKRISKPKGPKGASPPPEGWTATKALKVNNAALLSSSHSGRYSMGDERRQQHSSKMSSSGSQSASHGRKQQQESVLLGRKSLKFKKSTAAGGNTTTTGPNNRKSQPSISTATYTSTTVSTASTIALTSTSSLQTVKTPESRNIAVMVGNSGSGSSTGAGAANINATGSNTKSSIKIPIVRTPPHHPALVLSPGKEVKGPDSSSVVVTPCTVTCPRAPGQVPQLQCVRCLCLYHHECVGLLPQSTEYRTVRHKVGKEYICKVCQGLSSGSNVLTEKTVCLTPVRRESSLKAPLHFPQTIAVVKGKKYLVVSRSIKSNNLSGTSSGNVPLKISPMSTLPLSSSQPAENANDIENDLRQINEGMRKYRYSSPLIPPNMDAVFNARTPLTTQSLGSNVKASGSRSLLTTSSGTGTNELERMMSEELSQDILNNKIKERSAYLSKKYASNFFSNVSFAYDVLLRIFKYLKIHERPRAASVCKLWNLAAKDTSLWQTVRMKNSRVSNWSGFAAALHRGETKHLDLRKMLLSSGMRGIGGGSSTTASGNTVGNSSSSGGSGEDTWKEFCDNIGAVTSLEIIDLCRCSGRIVERLFKSNPNLRILNALAINDDRLNLSDIYHLHKLEELRLRTTELCTLNGCLLEEVDEMKQGNDEKILRTSDLQSLSMLENLRHLSLTSVKVWGLNNIADLSKLKQLVTLELGECGDFGTILPSNVLKELTNLQRLRLENGQLTDCCTLTILDVIHTHLSKLQQLELINFDIRSGFEEKLSLCKNLLKFLIIPTYISQSATTNNLVLSAVQKVASTLKVFTWGVTVELLRVTSLYVDQCKESIKTERSHFDECIPVLKPVPGAEKFHKMMNKTDKEEQTEINEKENITNINREQISGDDNEKYRSESQNNAESTEKSHSVNNATVASDNALDKSAGEVEAMANTSVNSDGNKSTEDEDMGEVPQIEILPLDRVEAILSENLPNTKFTIVKMPYHMTAKQHLVE